MGLDIYVKRAKTSNIKEVTWVGLSDANKQEVAMEVDKAVNRMVKSLERLVKDKPAYEYVDSPDYRRAYERRMRKVMRLVDYPQYELKSFAIRYIGGGSYQITSLTPSDLKQRWDELKPKFDGDKDVASFHKVNCLYGYFNGQDQELTKEVAKDILERAEIVRNNPSRGPELLPTCGGCFFGGTSYDDEYTEYQVGRIIEEFRKMLANWDEESTYMIGFSW